MIYCNLTRFLYFTSRMWRSLKPPIGIPKCPYPVSIRHCLKKVCNFLVSRYLVFSVWYYRYFGETLTVLTVFHLLLVMGICLKIGQCTGISLKPFKSPFLGDGIWQEILTVWRYQRPLQTPHFGRPTDVLNV